MQNIEVFFHRYVLNILFVFQLANAEYNFFNPVIFKVYDSDGNGKVSFNDILDILRDLTGQFISEHQREVSLPSLVIFFSSDVFLLSCLFSPVLCLLICSLPMEAVERVQIPKFIMIENQKVYWLSFCCLLNQNCHDFLFFLFLKCQS